MQVDNYEDLMKNQTENQRSTIYAEVTPGWMLGGGHRGMLRRMERDRYLLLFEEQYLSRFVDQKFDILDTIHQVVNSSGLAATLSIGIGKDGGSFQELMQYATCPLRWPSPGGRPGGHPQQVHLRVLRRPLQRRRRSARK